MNQPTDQELKEFLARQLPEKIIIYSRRLFWKPEDFYTNNELPKNNVLETELLQIVQWVEEKLSEELTSKLGMVHFVNYANEAMLRKELPEYMLKRTWQQKAQALKQILEP